MEYFIRDIRYQNLRARCDVARQPLGLSRNVKYGNSFSDGKSRGTTGGVNSSEAWFIGCL